MIADAPFAHTIHTVFEALAMMLGARYYVWLNRRAGGPALLEGGRFSVLLGCLLGAAIGNKLVFWLEVPHLWPGISDWRALLFGGQSMVGGLLGGLLGVELAKRLTAQSESTGDRFVGPVLLGLMIGRVGCFLAGLNDGTFGIATQLPWGIDFGDGIARHPTQLYEIGFAALLGLSLWCNRFYLAQVSGLSFKLMLLAYLAWRFSIDFLKPVPFEYAGGLSGIQWVCIVALILYAPQGWHSWRQLQRKKGRLCE